MHNFDHNKPTPLPLSVSVIIPTFNRAHVLSRAIDSVLQQTAPVSEVIIVDDGSTDETQALVSEYLRTHARLRYLKQDNRGVSAARNLGVRVAKHEWLAFLDSDDAWMPEKIAAQTDLIRRHGYLRIVHGNERWIRHGQFVNQMKKHRKSGGYIYRRCLERCLISPSAVMVHRQAFDECGGFREDFPVCEDYDLWLKMTARYSVGFVEEPIITKYGGHDDQLSRRYVAMDHWRVLSMLSLLQSYPLSPADKEATISEIRKKSTYLRQGYLKRGKKNAADALERSLGGLNGVIGRAHMSSSLTRAKSLST